MGCACSRKETHDFESYYFSSLEKDLALNYIKISVLSEIIKQKTKRLQYSNQTSGFFKKLSINYLKNLQFYCLFLKNETFDIQVLLTVFLLFSKAQIRDKALLLFQLYLNSYNSSLSRNEVVFMVTKIVDLSCGTIPDYILLMNKQDSELKNYVTQIKNNGTEAVAAIVYEILGNCKKISRIRFVEKIEEDCYYLLSMKGVRKFCNEYDKMKIQHAKYIYELDAPDRAEFFNAIAMTEEGELE